VVHDHDEVIAAALYLRVSRDSQTTDNQRFVLEADPESIRNDIFSRFKRLDCGGGPLGRFAKT
jgi:hypothetical protein